MRKNRTKIALMLVSGEKFSDMSGSLLVVEHSYISLQTPEDVLRAMRNAINDFLKTKDGLAAFKRLGNRFNWGDAFDCIPIKFWKKNGFHKFYHPDVHGEIPVDSAEEFKPEPFYGEFAKFDQYHQPVPSDLVTLPDIKNLTAGQIRTVNEAAWYEPAGRSLLLASAKELKGLSEDDPIDCDVDVKTATFMLVDDMLKRWNKADGFYHA
jgi:hypothetical protein